MATAERYNRFEEMDEAQAKEQAAAEPNKQKKLKPQEVVATEN